MDASDIGFTLAFPAELLDGLEAMAAGFELLDAAAAAGGDDEALAGQVFEVLSQALAPADGGVEPEEDGAAAVDPVPPTVPAAPVSRRRAGGLEAEPVTQVASSSPAQPGRAAAEPGMGRGGDGLVRRARSVPLEAAAGRSVAPGGQAEDTDEAEIMDLLLPVQAPAAGLPVTPTRGARSARAGRGGMASGRSGRSSGLGKSGLTASVAYARGAEGRMLDAIAPVQADITGGSGGTAEEPGSWAAGFPAGNSVNGRGGPSGASWDVRSVAPGVGAGGSAVRTIAPGGGLFPERAVAPQPQDGGGGDGGDRPVVLDGRLVGQWLSERMARDAARPGAGTTFFDPRQAPAWTPSGVL